MAVDLNSNPWNRLARLAPSGTDVSQLQEAADRYALRADLFAAAADLWEDYALSIDTSGDFDESADNVQSVTQDGISVTYRASQGAAVSRQMAAQRQAERFRRKAKGRTVALYNEDDNPYAPYYRDDNLDLIEDVFIELEE